MGLDPEWRIRLCAMDRPAHACDAILADVPRANLALVTAIYGTVRNAFERGLSEQEAADLRQDLTAMSRTNLAKLTA